MTKQKYGTREDIERLIKATKGDDGGIKKATKKKTMAKKPKKSK